MYVCKLHHPNVVCLMIFSFIHPLQRLKSLPSQFPEHAVSRNYLETILDLPWSNSTSDTLDLTESRKILDADHYAMEKVKKRVLEFLAVRQLKNSLKGVHL